MSIESFLSMISPLIAPQKLILSEQNGTRPAKPFATMTVRTVLPSRAEEHEVDESGDVLMSQQQLNAIEVQFYGDHAFEYASQLGLKLRYPTTQWLAESLNIGVARVNRALRVPELLNTSQFEERAILEFTAYDVLSGTDNVGLIESAEIDCFGHSHIVSKPPEV